MDEFTLLRGIVYIAFSVLLSAVFTSYFGVVVERGFKGSLAGRSHCDGCQRQLTWYENIPLLSSLYIQLFHKGKTSCCKKELSKTHLIAELVAVIAGVLFGLIAMQYEDFSWDLVILSLLYLAFLFLAVEDIWEYAILNNVVITMLVMALVRFVLAILGVIHPIIPLDWTNLLAALLYASFWQLLIFLSKGKGLGSGDVLVGAFIGLLLGWQLTLASFYFTVVIGGIVGIAFAMHQHKFKGLIIPMVPFLFFGTVLAVLYQREVLNYINWVIFMYT
jgi:prepilin signal peptidase PulO-like enzyme (type II secretory pathway)